MEWSLNEATLDASQRESPQMSCVEELLLLNRVQRDKRRNTSAERVYNQLFPSHRCQRRSWASLTKDQCRIRRPFLPTHSMSHFPKWLNRSSGCSWICESAARKTRDSVKTVLQKHLQPLRKLLLQIRCKKKTTGNRSHLHTDKHCAASDLELERTLVCGLHLITFTFA